MKQQIDRVKSMDPHPASATMCRPALDMVRDLPCVTTSSSVNWNDDKMSNPEDCSSESEVKDILALPALLCFGFSAWILKTELMGCRYNGDLEA